MMEPEGGRRNLGMPFSKKYHINEIRLFISIGAWDLTMRLESVINVDSSLYEIFFIETY